MCVGAYANINCRVAESQQIKDKSESKASKGYKHFHESNMSMATSKRTVIMFDDKNNNKCEYGCQSKLGIVVFSLRLMQPIKNKISL